MGGEGVGQIDRALLSPHTYHHYESDLDHYESDLNEQENSNDNHSSQGGSAQESEILQTQRLPQLNLYTPPKTRSPDIFLASKADRRVLPIATACLTGGTAGLTSPLVLH